MIRTSACARLLVALLATGSVADACASDVQEQRNRDGSRLRLQLRDLPDPDDAGFVRVLVDHAAPGAEGFVRRLDLVADPEGEPLRGASLVDIDGDGIHEVEVRGLCGAGPNCLGATGATDDATPLACAFQRRDGTDWTAIAPPGPDWLRLCDWYDAPYHVVLPDQAPGAGPSQEP
mgnify:CR=1 FL=1